ncbi:hypothetical protein L596_013450 [Steinernema carpocapsae]|uniref:RING-type domain-containing protein n=1 Tax=Steinernema carpocapsae TaxID=34508 RepID=A0A4U5P063_STECR|nr:hypothetical protein L596_013450 [Steinernema carpocapsae]
MTTYERFTCSICLEWLENSSPAISSTCGHVYHKACVENWIQRLHRRCPCCRQFLKNLRKLYFSTESCEVRKEARESQNRVDLCFRTHILDICLEWSSYAAIYGVVFMTLQAMVASIWE